MGAAAVTTRRGWVDGMSSFLPPKGSGEAFRKRSVFLSDEQWDDAEAIAEETGGQYDRQEVIRYAVDRLRAEWRERKAKKK